jgi:hypothetical protein
MGDAQVHETTNLHNGVLQRGMHADGDVGGQGPRRRGPHNGLHATRSQRLAHAASSSNLTVTAGVKRKRDVRGRRHVVVLRHT